MTLSAYRSHRIRFISIAVVLLLSIGSALAQSSLATNASILPGESERIDAFLQAYHSGVSVIMTATDSFGQTLSCVDIQHQPALNNPALKDHQVQLQPSSQLKAILRNIKEDDAPSPCPKGSVGMKLPTREQIVRAGSLKQFLSKYPDGSSGRFGVFGNIPPPSTGHEHAVFIQYVNAIGSQSTINVWDSAIESWGEFSLTQLWAIGGTGSGLQTVEVGSNVFPYLYGDSYPHLFIYFTADNYTSTGCYNLSCSAFVQTSNILTIGGTLSSSTSGGTQAEGTVAFARDPATGNWILFCFDGTNYIQSGYYPAALFGSGQLRQYADRLDFGGEVYSVNQSRHTDTDMGSGQFPNAGYSYAAYQRNLEYMGTNSTIYDFTGGSSVITNANCYNIAWGTNSSWGSSIYFGGPGYNSSQCP